MPDPDLLHAALSRLKEAAGRNPIDANVLERLRYAKEALKARLTIRMDDGETRSFLAFRCRYEDALGPTKGGIRFHTTVNLQEVESLAFWMTIKCAIAGLPYGGGKGGVAVDADALSLSELERLSRAYVRAFAQIIGPERDIPAPDVGTTAQVMGWMADEYGKVAGRPSPAAFTGKPVDQGGSAGREEATSLGGFILLNHFASRLGLKGNERVAIQGLGNVGLGMARLMADSGFRVVAVSDSRTSLIDLEGLDLTAIIKAKSEGQPIADASAMAQKGPPGAVLAAECDILIPSALENALTADNASAVQARVVLEMANGPTTPEADAILTQRGITVVPDVLANCGGVIVSYFEWSQNRKGEVWSIDQVRERLRERIQQAGDAVFSRGQTEGISIRSAAYSQGLARLSQAIAGQAIDKNFTSPEKSTFAAR